MSTGTALVTLKQAVRDALTIRPGLAAVQVTYAYPGAGGITGQDIWLGDAQSVNRSPVMRAGTKKVDETVSLMLFVQVLKTAGEGQEAADLRAAELLSEVQLLFAQSPQISPSIMSAQITQWVHSTGSFEGNESSHGSRFEIVIEAKARLGGS